MAKPVKKDVMQNPCVMEKIGALLFLDGVIVTHVTHVVRLLYIYYNIRHVHKALISYFTTLNI